MPDSGLLFTYTRVAGVCVAAGLPYKMQGNYNQKAAEWKFKVDGYQFKEWDISLFESMD